MKLKHFKAKIISSNKEKGEIKIYANDRKSAISELRSQGFLIVELDELAQPIEKILKVKPENKNLITCRHCNKEIAKTTTKDCVHCGGSKPARTDIEANRDANVKGGCLIFISVFFIVPMIAKCTSNNEPSTPETTTSEYHQSSSDIDERNREWRKNTGNLNMNSPEMSQQVTKDVLNFKSFDDIDNYSKEHPDR